jgi:hypothetical protein
MADTQAHLVNGNGTAVGNQEDAAPSEMEMALPELDGLTEELNRLASINAELVGRLRSTTASPTVSADESDELTGLRVENAELKARIAELEQGQASQGNDEGWAERQREYEALLEEKSEVIRTLHLKLQEQQEAARRLPDEPLPPEEVLYQLKKDLDEQRRQLQEDEESVMAQMRQMELSLSKDRAELARQRQEVQRIQADLNREIEQASRDPELRERLNSLRRSHEPARKEAAAAGVAESAKGVKQSSGIFKRLFG